MFAPLAPLMRWGARAAQPLLHMLPPEAAHTLTLKALKAGLVPPSAAIDPPSLHMKAFGLEFKNPIGVAAGLDKNAEVPGALHKLGFGFVEVGSVTPHPQAGNPRPRIFRLAKHQAVINRLGFNNQGHEAVKQRLEIIRDNQGPGPAVIIGVNLGANKDSTDRIADYVAGVKAFERLASYLTINISSPNTPGLRSLQDRAVLEDLVARVLAARTGATPILLKIAPDLGEDEVTDIAQIVQASAIDGLIVSNTTIAREGLVDGPHAEEQGGLSGQPLFGPSTSLLRQVYRLTGGAVPLIGVGGVASGAQAYEKIRAGASLVQLYTGLTYHGPTLVDRIRADLANLLARDGFAHVADAVGTGDRQ